MDHRQRLELLALRLALHGLEAADPRVIRSLARTPSWPETRLLLLSYGFTKSEIAELTGAHYPGCPCWACVWALNRAALAHQKKLQKKLDHQVGTLT